MKCIYFSPKSTTKRIAKGVAQAWAGADEVDLLLNTLEEGLTVAAEEPVVVALPVYAGRIPPHCADLLTRLRGTGGPAVAVVVYGNRAYDDALLELTDLLTRQNFQVVAAGAFVGRHSIYTQVAKDRPHQGDLDQAVQFGTRARTLCEGAAMTAGGAISVPGNSAYQETPARGIPLKPVGNRNCVKCRACVRRCPKGAIPTEDPTQTEAQKCISCGLCIYICPMEARGYFGDDFPAMAAAFAEKNSQPKQPEIFFR